jgi:hypothetical protein
VWGSKVRSIIAGTSFDLRQIGTGLGGLLFVQLDRRAISEPFRFNVVTVLISGIRLAPTNGSDEQFTSNVLAIFAGSAIGTALLAFELLKTWGLA